MGTGPGHAAGRLQGGPGDPALALSVGIAMAYLTLKARRFVDYAMSLPENAQYQREWATWRDARPPSPEPMELTTEAAHVVVEVLRRYQRWLSHRIDVGPRDDDLHADMGNDLSFIAAVERDLARSVAQ